MSAKVILAVLAACVCVAYGGNLPIATYAYGHAPLATYAAAPLAATYAHTPIAHAPIATYAAAPILVDNTHFSYGYQNPFGNGRVDVARNGPVGSHAYNFLA